MAIKHCKDAVAEIPVSKIEAKPNALPIIGILIVFSLLVFVALAKPRLVFSSDPPGTLEIIFSQGSGIAITLNRSEFHVGRVFLCQ